MERLDMLMEMLENDGPEAFTLYAIAQEHRKKGDFVAADTWYRKTVEHDPDYVAAYHQWGLAAAEANDLNRAEEILREGIAVAERIGDTHAAEEIEEALEEL